MELALLGRFFYKYYSFNHDKTHLKFVFPVDKTGLREYFLINLNYGTSFLQFRRIPC